MGQNVVKINMQIYDVYNVSDIPMDVASCHNSQLSQPFMEALHQTPLSYKEIKGLRWEK